MESNVKRFHAFQLIHTYSHVICGVCEQWLAFHCVTDKDTSAIANRNHSWRRMSSIRHKHRVPQGDPATSLTSIIQLVKHRLVGAWCAAQNISSIADNDIKRCQKWQCHQFCYCGTMRWRMARSVCREEAKRLVR